MPCANQMYNTKVQTMCPSRLSPQWLCCKSCRLAHDVPFDALDNLCAWGHDRPVVLILKGVHSFLKQRLNIRDSKPNSLCNLLLEILLMVIVIAKVALY